MDEELKTHIVGMLAAAHPSPEQVNEIIAGWEHYFAWAGVSAGGQAREFHAIIRARFAAGSISLVAPSPLRVKDLGVWNVTTGEIV